MIELVEFLRARYADAKQHVLSVGPARLGWGTYLHPDGGMGYTSPVASVDGDDADWVTAGEATHPDVVTVVFDPADVLADIDAKLRIVNQLSGVITKRLPDEDLPRSFARTARENALHTLWLLALPFAGHADYQKEWRVS